jgi:hypothetical protein
LSAAFTLAEGRITVGALARACGVTTSAVGRWLRHDGQVKDPAMIETITIAFYEAGVLLEHGAGVIEEDGDDRPVVDGWRVRPVGEV